MNFLRIYSMGGRTLCNNSWCKCIEYILDELAYSNDMKSTISKLENFKCTHHVKDEIKNNHNY